MAAAGAAAVALVLGFLFAGARFTPHASLADGARFAWLLFYVFHHVGIEVQSPALHLPAHADVVAGLPTGYPVDATVALGLMGGGLLAGWLLYRGGRRIGRAVGGSIPNRGLHAAKVGLPYALLAWAASWGLHLTLRLPGASPLAIHPSHIASFFWPLAFGVVASCAGGVLSTGPALWTSDWWESDRWNRRIPGALAGGTRMLLAGLAVSCLSLAGLAVARPHDAAAYFHAVGSGGPAGGAAVVGTNVLAIPNMAAWLMVPAMGGCIEVSGSGVYQPYCFVSYGAYAGHVVPNERTSSGYPAVKGAPPAFYLFLLLPLVTVIAGGVRAARRGRARSRAEGAGIGAMAGVVFGILFLVALTQATVAARLNGAIFIVSTGYWRYGPNPATGLQLSLAWGVLGGVVGGWLAGPSASGPEPSDEDERDPAPRSRHA